MTLSMYIIGIDIGGTFTDLALIDDTGHLHTYKSESTPDDLSKGVINSLKLASDDLGISIEHLLKNTARFAHGTTAATNDFIERKGARTGLITTSGFGDTLLIGRLLIQTTGLSEEEILHFSARDNPAPIVPPVLIKEVRERVDYKGAIIVPLNERDVRAAARNLLKQGAESIAVCFLWSFKNPAHEEKARSIIAKEAPGLPVALSSELVPVLGEYERMATTAINAYLGPRIERYMNNLKDKLAEMGLGRSISILNSIGGVLPIEAASQQAHLLLESGPAGGVIASKHLADTLGYANIITTDMGGTSFDVGLIVDGRPLTASIAAVGRYHLLAPTIDIVSIGSGGGSIARVEDGYLKVGPQSAGARPGPACYGLGGAEPTVTDADVALGYIDPAYFLGGRWKLNKEKAEASIREKIAKPLGLSVIEAASGIRTIVDNQMSDLLRKATIERGYDPRDFLVFAYGGAGPVHCSAYSSDLGVKKVVIPPTAMVHSAFGAALSDFHYSFQLTDTMRTPAQFDIASKYLDVKRIYRNFQTLKKKGLHALKINKVSQKDMSFHFTLGMKFRRQTHELFIAVQDRTLKPADIDILVEKFETQYEERYGKGSAFRTVGVEITTFRLDAIGATAKPEFHAAKLSKESASTAKKKDRKVYFAEFKKFYNTSVYDGAKLKAGYKIPGPAIVEYSGTTVVINPDMTAVVDKYLNIVIEL